VARIFRAQLGRTGPRSTHSHARKTPRVKQINGKGGRVELGRGRDKFIRLCVSMRTVLTKLHCLVSACLLHCALCLSPYSPTREFSNRYSVCRRHSRRAGGSRASFCLRGRLLTRDARETLTDRQVVRLAGGEPAVCRQTAPYRVHLKQIHFYQQKIIQVSVNNPHNTLSSVVGMY
jgi:hypothetical protein